MEPSEMKFKITYVSRSKLPRVVSGEHFTNSSAYWPVLQMKVGEIAPTGRYRTAGYAKIQRIA